MLMRSDPFQVFDRPAQQMFGTTAPRPAMPVDAYRDGDRFVVLFDLPGVRPESIDVSVRNKVLTVRAERAAVGGDEVETLISERPSGEFSRQLFLDDTLDTDKIEAGYHAGVLALRIPVADKAKPRRIAVTSGAQQAIGA